MNPPEVSIDNPRPMIGSGYIPPGERHEREFFQSYDDSNESDPVVALINRLDRNHLGGGTPQVTSAMKAMQGHITPFSGETLEVFETWIERYVQVMRALDIRKRVGLKLIPIYLTDSALKKYRTLSSSETLDWDAFVFGMCKKLKDPLKIEDAHRSLMTTKQNSKSVETYANEIEKLSKMAMQGQGKKAREETTIRFFLQGLRPDIRKALRVKAVFDSFEEAKSLALREESFLDQDELETIRAVKLEEAINQVVNPGSNRDQGDRPYQNRSYQTPDYHNRGYQQNQRYENHGNQNRGYQNQNYRNQGQDYRSYQSFPRSDNRVNNFRGGYNNGNNGWNRGNGNRGNGNNWNRGGFRGRGTSYIQPGRNNGDYGRPRPSFPTQQQDRDRFNGPSDRPPIPPRPRINAVRVPNLNVGKYMLGLTMILALCATGVQSFQFCPNTGHGIMIAVPAPPVCKTGIPSEMRVKVYAQGTPQKIPAVKQYIQVRIITVTNYILFRKTQTHIEKKWTRQTQHSVSEIGIGNWTIVSRDDTVFGERVEEERLITEAGFIIIDDELNMQSNLGNLNNCTYDEGECFGKDYSITWNISDISLVCKDNYVGEYDSFRVGLTVVFPEISLVVQLTGEKGGSPCAPAEAWATKQGVLVQEIKRTKRSEKIESHTLTNIIQIPNFAIPISEQLFGTDLDNVPNFETNPIVHPTVLKMLKTLAISNEMLKNGHKYYADKDPKLSVLKVVRAIQYARAAMDREEDDLMTMVWVKIVGDSPQFEIMDSYIMREFGTTGNRGNKVSSKHPSFITPITEPGYKILKEAFPPFEVPNTTVTKTRNAPTVTTKTLETTTTEKPFKVFNAITQIPKAKTATVIMPTLPLFTKSPEGTKSAPSITRTRAEPVVIERQRPWGIKTTPTRAAQQLITQRPATPVVKVRENPSGIKNTLSHETSQKPKVVPTPESVKTGGGQKHKQKANSELRNESEIRKLGTNPENKHSKINLNENRVHITERMLLDEDPEVDPYVLLRQMQEKMAAQAADIERMQKAMASGPPPPPPPPPQVEEANRMTPSPAHGYSNSVQSEYGEHGTNIISHFNTICRVASLRAELVRILLRIDPTSAARLLLHRSDVTAKAHRDVLEIQECTELTIQKVYMDHKVNGSCYGELPVLTEKGLMFMRANSDQLRRETWEIPCSDRIKMTELIRQSQQMMSIYNHSIPRQKPPWHDKPIDYGAKQGIEVETDQIGTYIETWLKDIVINKQNMEKWVTADFWKNKVNGLTSESKRIGNVTARSMANVAVITAETIKRTNPRQNRWLREGRGERLVFNNNIIHQKWKSRKWYGRIIDFFKCKNTCAIEDDKLVVKQELGIAAVRTGNPFEQIDRDVEMNDMAEMLSVPRVYAVTTGKSTTNELVPRINMEMNGEIVQCLIDTGATTSYCGITIAKKIGIRKIKTNNPIQARTADGSRFSLFGQYGINVRVGTKSIQHKVHVSEDSCCPESVLLGADFLYCLNEHGMEVCFNMLKQTVKLGSTVYRITQAVPRNHIFHIDTREMQSVKIPVRMTETVKIPARTEMLVPLLIDNVLWKSGSDYLIEDNHKESTFIYILGASIVTPDKDGGCFGVVLNPTKTVVTLYKGSSVGHAQEIEPDSEICDTKNINYVEYNAPEITWQNDLPWMPQPRPENFDISKEVFIHNDIKPEDREKIETLIRKYEHVFIGPDGILGHYTGRTRHRIDLKDENSVPRARIYRIPLEKRKVVEEQIEEMLRQGIIRPSDSPFAAPIVLVRKADKSWRFTVDFRALNAQSKLAQSVLPNIQDIVDMTASKAIYSTLDFGSGFHQIDMEPEHCERTAFACFLGAYEYIRMPMGLSGAPGTFQRVMDDMLKNMKARAFVYVDDLIIASDDMDAHIRDLEEVFSRISNIGMRLKPKKCKIAYKEVEFLGYLISEEGVKPNPKKVKSIREYPQPKTIKELRSFIGMASFFRRFIEGFSIIARPLTELTKKDQDFVFGPEQQKAFEQLKEMLITAPILVPPQLGKPFIIETDASGRGLAAVLRQGDGRNAKVIAYASRATNKHECRYPALELEGLAIVYAIKEFRPYIDGAEVTVITDHAPLRAMLTGKNLEGRLGKYQLQIQNYDLEIIYRPGRKNFVCDALSRNLPEEQQTDTVQTQNTESVHLVSVTVPLWKTILTKERVKELQQTSQSLNTVKSGILRKEAGEVVDDPHLEKYLVIDDILHKIPDEVEVARRAPMILPENFEEKTELIRTFHESKLGTAHLGMNKTASALADVVTWSGLQKDVADVIRKCVVCQRVKSVSAYTTIEPLGQFEQINGPNERIHIDHIGPLPKTMNGNTFILTMVDAFSKYAQAIPVPDIKSVTSVEALVTGWISVHGCPVVVVTDGGSSFTSSVFEDTLKMLRIKHATTRPYRHQTNGQVERFNHTLEKMIATTREQQSNDWDAHLPWLTLAHNTTIAKTTGFTPFYVTFGRNHMNPLIADLGIPRKRFFDLTDYVQMLRFTLDTVRESIGVSIQQAQTKEASRYNLRNRTKTSDYKIGDKVLEKIVRLNKITPVYSEPATVVDTSYPNITIQNKEGKKRTVHMDHIKIFHE